MPISFSARVAVPPHVLVQTVGDESVLLDLRRETYFGLDSIGTRMWQALTQAESVDVAYRALLGAYEVDPDRLRKDIEQLLENLVTNGLLETSDE